MYAFFGIFFEDVKLKIEKLNVLHLFAKNLNNSIIPLLNVFKIFKFLLLINILSTILYFTLLIRLTVLLIKFSMVCF